MKYKHYTVTDFVNDREFQRWVTASDPSVDAHWRNWLAKNPEKRATIEEARHLILLLKFGNTYRENERFLQVWKRLDGTWETFRQDRKKHVIPKLLAENWYRTAAVFAGLLLISAVCFWALPWGSTVRHATRFGETRALTLPDGTAVTLNANSSLEFLSNLSGQGPREVWLDGEAFFEVVKDRSKKNATFIVHTRALDVEVLGTRFNVHNRRGKTQVVLRSGKVSIHLPHGQPRNIVMAPGELVEVSEKENTYLKIPVNPEMYSSWVNKELILDQTPLQDIAHLLEDYYGLQVVMRGEGLPERTLTGRIPTGDLALILKLLSEAFSLNISRQQDTLLIGPAPTHFQSGS